MKEFKINAQQLQILLNVLGEFPANKVINAIDMLRNLQELQNTATE